MLKVKDYKTAIRSLASLDEDITELNIQKHLICVLEDVLAFDMDEKPSYEYNDLVLKHLKEFAPNFIIVHQRSESEFVVYLCDCGKCCRHNKYICKETCEPKCLPEPIYKFKQAQVKDLSHIVDLVSSTIKDKVKMLDWLGEYNNPDNSIDEMAYGTFLSIQDVVYWSIWSPLVVINLSSYTTETQSVESDSEQPSTD